MRKALIIAILVGLMSLTVRGQSVKEITYPSSADNSNQPAMFYAPESKKAVPLVVALHTWSANYKQKKYKSIEAWCVKKGWAYIHPDFRGPNKRPQSTGSELVVKDIVSAVEYAKKATAIDSTSIYLVGTSGGGFAALLMAGRHPEIWAGVTAWVPISDLKAWYAECKKAGRGYYKNIAASCGGAPGDSPKVDKEYRIRSPITYLAKAKGLKLHINAGIHDGHKGSVPISHSLLAFNEVAEAKDRIAQEDIRSFAEKPQVPEGLKVNVSDPTYGKNKPLFRRTSGSATVTIFQGGHQIVPSAAIAWIQAVHSTKKKAK